MGTFRQKRSAPIAVSTLLLLVAGACADPVAPPTTQSRPGGPSLLDAGSGYGEVRVCKDGPTGRYYNFTASATAGAVTSPFQIYVPGVDPNQFPCVLVLQQNGAVSTLTVTETGADPALPGYVPTWQVYDDFCATFAGCPDFTPAQNSAVSQTGDLYFAYTFQPTDQKIIVVRNVPGCTDRTASNYGQPGECKYPPPPPPTGKGCTPGYWKVSQHWDSWPAGYTPSQSIATYFPAASGYTLNGSSMGSYSLVQGLAFQGGSDLSGGAQILLRAGIAGLLNSASSFGGYPTTTSQLLSSVNAALASGDRATMIALAATIDANNNLGCPLN
ncbi:MAG TPA: hypothetical protein VHM30_07015 [Gemmatimonadaceae bacterium]|nr:hypothetical protein [Gemmatimonadaceae bacterium]